MLKMIKYLCEKLMTCATKTWIWKHVEKVNNQILPLVVIDFWKFLDGKSKFLWNIQILMGEHVGFRLVCHPSQDVSNSLITRLSSGAASGCW